MLIAHNPVHFPAYAAWGADLTVSGHLHGGFVRLPLLGGVVSPQFLAFFQNTPGASLRKRVSLWQSAQGSGHTHASAARKSHGGRGAGPVLRVGFCSLRSAHLLLRP